MNNPVKSYQEFIKENNGVDPEDTETNDFNTDFFISKYIYGLEKLDDSVGSEF